jgi:hypothetical protein
VDERGRGRGLKLKVESARRGGAVGGQGEFYLVLTTGARSVNRSLIVISDRGQDKPVSSLNHAARDLPGE